jgi:hypothetical protein
MDCAFGAPMPRLVWIAPLAHRCPGWWVAPSAHSLGYLTYELPGADRLEPDGITNKGCLSVRDLLKH